MSTTSDEPVHLLVSGYNSGPQDPGVSRFSVSADEVHATLLDQMRGIESPSYCIRCGSQLFFASETSTRGGLASGMLDDAGNPSLISTLAFKDAAGTCFVLKHPQKDRLYGADYNSGSVCSCTVSAEGKLEPPVTLVQHEGHGLPRPNEDPNAGRQSSPHVHTLSFIPNTTLIAAVDLGLDLIVVYKTNAEGQIIDAPDEPVMNLWPDQLASTSEEKRPFYRLPIRPAALIEAPPLSGPRIIAYHPNKRFAALICELSCELIIFELEAGGLIWRPQQRIDLLQWAKKAPANGAPPLAAHVEFSADGRFLYASVRGADQLIMFELEGTCAQKKVSVYSSQGGTPRHFALSPSQTLLAVANQTGNNVALFNRDPRTGALEATTSIPYPTPSCIVWE